MLIEIINVQSSTKATAKGGTYTQLDVAFKNKTFGDKVEGRKVMSFTDKDVFATLSKATTGQQYEVDVVKEGQYNQWKKVTPMEQTSAASSGYATPNKSTPSPKSTYETPEERALRQRMIVRQSSLSNAIDTLSVNPGKDKLQIADVLQVATDYFDWVMQTDDPVDMDIGNMSDDIPC